MSDPSLREEALAPVVDSFLDRFRKGERPSIEEYASRYPDLAAAIRDVLPALVAVEQDLTIDPGEPARQAAGRGSARAAWRLPDRSARSAEGEWESSMRPCSNPWGDMSP